jgi:hypothetical protein
MNWSSKKIAVRIELEALTCKEEEELNWIEVFRRNVWQEEEHWMECICNHVVSLILYVMLIEWKW